MAKLISPRTKSICYNTRKVETSVALLESPENEVVLEALVYLSKFVHDQIKNLKYIQQSNAVDRLLNLLDRNICILRLSLRLLGVLLTLDEVASEIDQEIYDDKVLRLLELYVTSQDHSVKKFCLSILTKLTKSSRIVCLIFKTELIYQILDDIKTTKDKEILEWSLEMFLKVLSVPAAVDVLPDIAGIDISILVKVLDNSENNIVHLVLKIIHELTRYCTDIFQIMFREAKLVEKMLDIVTEWKKQEYHDMAFDIIINCMKSEETSDYFVESLEFLKFCQWVKTCDEKYHFTSICILEALTKIPLRRQILFDLSVEEAICSFFRSTDKKTLNKTCEAITNMVAHRYCCQELLTPTLLKELFQMLFRKDQEDPANEVALETIFAFTRQNVRTLDMIYKWGAQKVLLGYFKKEDGFLTEESFLGLMEILNTMSLNPSYQQDMISYGFIQKLMRLFRTASTKVAAFATEIMIHLTNCTDFRRFFLSLAGPKSFVKTLASSRDLKLLKNILFFIHGNLIHDDVSTNFIRNGVVKALREFPDTLKLYVPILHKILKLIYNRHLPLKLFYMKKLDITDKLEDNFYLIKGQWKTECPFYEDLETIPHSPLYATYIVDYSFVAKYEDGGSELSIITPRKISSERTMSMLTQVSSSLSSYFRRKSVLPNYGKLSSDPFLPRYISNATKYLNQVETMDEKVKILAQYVNAIFCRPEQDYTKIDKIHTVDLHTEFLKHKLGSNLIPVGFLRVGGHCERALLFKAMGDKCHIPATLVKGKCKLYWNEVILFDTQPRGDTLKMYVVDLMDDIGRLLPVGSRVANQYCNINIDI